jgi:molecular chaperone DnaK
MRLGIDFGTTHTVVAATDRGNFPVVSFDELGNALPSFVAVRARDGALRFGAAAAAAALDPAWTLVRSLKRLLHDAGPHSEIELAGRRLALLDLLVAFLGHLRQALRAGSSLELAGRERLEAAIGVPANASSAQRFLTLEAFRRAGFAPIALVNEPSAAGFEYAHRHRRARTSRREHVVVYDLGGGTFDASLVRMTGAFHEVLASEGVARLGGDDFDAAIAQLVLRSLGVPELAPAAHAALVEECRRAKEALSPNTRRLLVDLAPLGREPLGLPVEQVFAACEPLVLRTLDTLERVVGPGSGVGWEDVAGLYVVGGASAFPSIPRRLRERFGERRVHRSPHPFAATAIGLAVLADEGAGVALSDRLARHYGVWRESEAGRGVVFDPIFPKGTVLPAPSAPPVEAVRRYQAAHNLGHYRVVECGRVRDGLPDGELLPWSEIRFPFDASLQRRPRLDAVAVHRLEAPGPWVEERWLLGADGVLELRLALPEAGLERHFQLARPAAA